MDLTLSKAISAGHAAEETREHARKILRSQPVENSRHNTRNQNSRDFIKSVNLVVVHIPEANAQLMEKFVMFVIKRTISKFAVHVLVKNT